MTQRTSSASTTVARALQITAARTTSLVLVTTEGSGSRSTRPLPAGGKKSFTARCTVVVINGTKVTQLESFTHVTWKNGDYSSASESRMIQIITLCLRPVISLLSPNEISRGVQSENACGRFPLYLPLSCSPKKMNYRHAQRGQWRILTFFQLKAEFPDQFI